MPAKTSTRSFCLSISKRNRDIIDLIDDASDQLHLSKADAVFYMIREYRRLKRLEDEGLLGHVKTWSDEDLIGMPDNKQAQRGRQRDMDAL